MSDIRQALCADIYMSDEYQVLNGVMNFMLRCGFEWSLYDGNWLDETHDTLMLRFCMRFERK